MNSKTVCVTGATGFVASHLTKQLLQLEYIVHGTVRSLKATDKHQFLREFPNASDRTLQLFEANLNVEGSFDEAVKVCFILLHHSSLQVKIMMEREIWLILQ
jgi:dihydroflavonol-4-reductase